ncbi:MAG TPA: alpha/beta fold hydrolase [Polyangia bacterium]|jgi:pimeloyl-ACP methyl ester carboxylesterase/DNA-binding winged helix-turn-helix (wHTH) protein|nr:alpha/beta fold hydrolase [Polyangia bacterium]
MAPVYRFGPFELNVDARELRRGPDEIPVQPQVFAFLSYLIEHRDRVVGKAELLERLWPDAVVLEASLQRSVSQARAALGDEDHAFIRTFSRHGYRFVGPVEESAPTEAAASAKAPARPPAPPPASMVSSPAVPRALPPLDVRYARSAGLHIAYAIAGAGTVDIVLVLGWTFPFRALARLAETAGTLSALTEIGRVVLFDKRGTGLSDPVKRLASLDERMDDLRAVLDAAGSRQAVLLGLSEGGALCMLFAAAYPERVRGLVLVGAFPRMAAAPDWPAGWSPERAAAARAYIKQAWGGGQTILALAPRAASRPDFRRFAAETEQEGASPGAALDVLEMNLRVDVRPLLATIRAPTHVLHRTDDGIIDVRNGRALAAAIPGAQLTELPGDDHVFLFEDNATLVAAVRALAGRVPSPPAADERVLAAVLAVAPGTRPPASAIPGEALADITRQVASHGGRALAPPLVGGTFASPRRALACGLALAEAWPPLRLAAHVGEVETGPGGGAVGSAVDEGQALLAAVPPGQLWISRVLADLLPGAGFIFEPTTSSSLRCLAGTA